MYNQKVKIEKGFNLAELLIVFSVLCLVALLMIPATINNVKASQQRLKLKKAVASYDSAIKLFQVDYNAKNINSIDKRLGQQCKNIKKYFIVLKDEGCIFYTNDEVWYNFKTSNHQSVKYVAVAFEKEDLSKAYDENYNGAFLFVASMNKGQLNINNYDYGNADITYNFAVNKIYKFLNKKSK